MPLKPIGSMYFAVGLILILAVVLGWATFVDSQYGGEAAGFAIYKTWWFMALNGLLGLSVLASALTRLPWKKRHLGFLVTHLGILVLMLGCFITFRYGEEGTLGLAEGENSAVAVKKSLHFRIEILSNSGEIAQSWEKPFVPGPFSWRHYSHQPDETQPSPPPTEAERLPVFPWSLPATSRKKPVVLAQENLTLEVLDYCTSARLRPPKSAEEKPDVEGFVIEPLSLEELRDKKHGSSREEGLHFVKIRLTCDGNKFEGWLEAFVPDPMSKAPNAELHEIFTLPGKDRSVRVAFCADTIDLGFRLRLDRFNRRLDPGTSTPSHYSSDVTLLDVDDPTKVVQEDIRVLLNQPVDFADTKTGRVYRVFQSSFRGPFSFADPIFRKLTGGNFPRDHIYISWFSVSYSPGRGLLYLGCLFITAGVGIMYSMKTYFFARKSQSGNPNQNQSE